METLDSWDLLDNVAHPVPLAPGVAQVLMARLALAAFLEPKANPDFQVFRGFLVTKVTKEIWVHRVTKETVDSEGRQEYVDCRVK